MRQVYQSDTSGSARLRPSAGLHGQSSSSSSRTDLQKLTIKDLKNRLSDLGVEESSFKYDKKQTLVDKVFQLENAMSKKVSKCPPKAKPKAVSKPSNITKKRYTNLLLVIEFTSSTY